MKIRPINEMYNVDLHRLFMPGVVADVPDELAQEYIEAGNAVPVEEKARAEPFHTLPEYTPENLPEYVSAELLPEAEKPKKPRTSKAKKTT